MSRLALSALTRSTCPRLAVGAVVVRDKRILTTGYNGSPSGMSHCEDVGCLIPPVPEEIASSVTSENLQAGMLEIKSPPH